MTYYKLHLIRHGLTAGNLEGRYVGSGTDLPLCEQGREQLEQLKEQFDYPPVPLVFTSPLKRAKQTAALLYPDAQVIELEDLREMAFGIFEGHLLQDLLQDPGFAAWMNPETRTTPAGAEAADAFYKRTGTMLMKMFEYMLKTHTTEAACVSHAGVLGSMLAQHALPQRRMEEWVLDPGCGYSVRCDAEMWMRDQLAETYAILPSGYGE